MLVEELPTFNQSLSSNARYRVICWFRLCHFVSGRSRDAGETTITRAAVPCSSCTHPQHISRSKSDESAERRCRLEAVHDRVADREVLKYFRRQLDSLWEHCYGHAWPTTHKAALHLVALICNHMRWPEGSSTFEPFDKQSLSVKSDG